AIMRVAIFIDGGHIRVLAKASGFHYNPDFIEKVAHNCLGNDEELLRVLYYDCAPYIGSHKKPVSGDMQEFKGSDGWLHILAQKDLFAVRLGVLKFRGFKPISIPISEKLNDDDFKPDFEQKGVDMRIGLDIASYSASKAIDRIILVSGDTDCIPAMKHARKAGLQIVLITFPAHKIASELLEHADYRREISWPKQDKKIVKKSKA
ncbi:NYN domain-containing protein, partial [Rhodomicrobium sp.]